MERASSSKRKKGKPKTGRAYEPTEYEPTKKEQAALAKRAHRLEDEAPAPRIKVLGDGKFAHVSFDHPSNSLAAALLAEALGTTSEDFVLSFLEQLGPASSSGGGYNERSINFMLDVIKGLKPTDQLEAMLAAQMAAVHVATMRFAALLAHADGIQQDITERAFNKLARTFATQMEALKRYRTGGEQKVTVQYVSVNEGGQAIVGNVNQAPRATAPKKSADGPLALAAPTERPMTMIDEPDRAPVLSRRRQKVDRQSPT